MHYVVLLAQQGLSPYRDIGDYNLPGAYLPNWLATVTAGALRLSQASVWRVFDIGGMLLAGAVMLRICWPVSKFAGIFASALFILAHGRDGVGQAGQRDFWVAVLLLYAIAVVLQSLRNSNGTGDFGKSGAFAFLIATATTIKPVALLFLLCAVPVLYRANNSRRLLRLLLTLSACFIAPFLVLLLFLERWATIHAFVGLLRRDLPYHVSLGNVPFLYLLKVCAPFPLVLIAVCAFSAWLLATLLPAVSPRGPSQTPAKAPAFWPKAERSLLLLCVFLGLLYYLLQGKSYPYQRYPFEAFLLLAVALRLAVAIRSESKVLRGLAVVGFSFGVLSCAPTFLRTASKARWTGISLAIEQALRAQAGPGGLATLDGQVQCIDSVSGCTEALLHLRLRQTTGTMYDELLFPSTPVGPRFRYFAIPPAFHGPAPVAVSANERQFQQAVSEHPPRIFIMSRWLFPQGPDNYDKLALWPWFAAYLQANYTLIREQNFPRSENGPSGFRVYVRRFE